ncbi:NAD(P)-dependent oxidoreductase [Thermomonospora umbrina]|uniref:3-hydroxyisobutyrate dehydrogenase-like beta-hydroxyacid dehydrogenase n=1 Tax=Thermomonospora umbrina TaxID=111806 RepID=A0A3D9SQL4_9ACTN|nr:NAD(P)-binding domain-containing protein [Thermomonospora umbrina]REE97917.1 3-hydroxyisobutyrate dehydrogenase-like beta-hydroxyacid dehydrogenase [Thermomonospora umbrina]
MEPSEDVRVTVIGLNARGAALARVIASRGVAVTVWDDAEVSPIEGVVRVDSVRGAFTGVSLVLLCVDEYDSAERILGQAEPYITGTDVVNVTSGTSTRAEELAAWVHSRGGHYLDGALMAHPEHVGKPETVLVYSGSLEVFERHEPSLKLLGGATYLGEAPGAAALYDVAMLNFAWATLIGFLQSVVLLGTARIRAGTVTPLLTHWLSTTVTDVIDDYARQVDERHYPGDEEWLELDAPLMDHLLEATRARGLDTALPELIKSLTVQGIDAGHGRNSFASLAEILRGRSNGPS